VAAVLAVAIVVVVLVLVLGGSDDSDGSDDKTVAADPTPSETASESATPAAPYACWDGAAAAQLADCSAPSGEAGLAWLFPAMADARCGKANAAGGEGVVTRVLCVYRASDGTRVQLGYFEWASVDAAAAFYAAQGLVPTDAADGTTRTYAGTQGATTKTGTLYLGAPFSVTATYPSGVTLTPEDQAALAPRPASELSGVAAQ
jgi:hypothetical protein